MTEQEKVLDIAMDRMIDDVVDLEVAGCELTYRSYRTQRIARPDIPAQNWAKIFQNQAAMEARFQKEAAL
jgi:hypothetical protein